MEKVFWGYMSFGMVSTIALILASSGQNMPRGLQWMYDHTKMNIMGCCVCTLILVLLFPFYYAAYFLWWVFHIGRKDKNDL